MDRRIRTAPRADERLGLHGRFLRPGALARLRDSRIVARSLRSAARLALPSVPPPLTTQLSSAETEQQVGVPHFLRSPTRGMGGAARYPLRRRMVASRRVVFLPPAAATDAFFDAFAPSSGLVAAL